jgi:glycosyltransferase involved in cell wall biosynthesis
VKISIITVVYNGAQTIEDCLKSVLSQDYPDLEYIVIDGASTDGTLQRIEQFDQSPYSHHINKLLSEPDEGLYFAMNKGIQMATGEVIGMLNADDLYATNDCLSAVAAMFSTQPIDATYADLVYVSQQNPDQVTRYWKSGTYRKGAFLWGWMPPHPTFFLKKTFMTNGVHLTLSSALLPITNSCCASFTNTAFAWAICPECSSRCELVG